MFVYIICIYIIHRVGRLTCFDVDRESSISMMDTWIFEEAICVLEYKDSEKY